MMADENGKPKSTENDPDQIARLLELELLQKRAAWKQASERHRAFKSASFLFLFIVIIAAVVGFYLIFSQVSERRGRQPATPVPAESTP